LGAAAVNSTTTDMTIIKPIQQKDTVMKMKNNLLSKIITVTQSKWMQPALMALALLVAVLGVTGCKPHH
jgi:hypothetical protein